MKLVLSSMWGAAGALLSSVTLAQTAPAPAKAVQPTAQAPAQGAPAAGAAAQAAPATAGQAAPAAAGQAAPAAAAPAQPTPPAVAPMPAGPPAAAEPTATQSTQPTMGGAVTASPSLAAEATGQPDVEVGERPPGLTLHDRTLAIVSWDMSLPLGSANDFIPEMSFRGIDVAMRHFISPRFALGANFTWNRFTKDLPRSTYDLDNGAITATLYRSIESFAFRGTAHYAFLDRGYAIPYIGLGLGASTTEISTIAADLWIGDSGWYFATSPEVGVLLGAQGAGRAGGLALNVRYTYLPASYGNVSNVQYLSFQVGLFAL